MKSIVLVVAFVAGLSVAQMTFSDGWEKRQGSHHKMTRSAGVEREEEGPQKVELESMESCNTEYSLGLTRLYHKMMQLYSRFKSCQARNPLVVHQEPPQSLADLVPPVESKTKRSSRYF